MGVPTLRLRADYLAIVTIAIAEIIRLFVRSVKFKEVFGGSDGINDFSGEFRQVGVDVGIKPGQELRVLVVHVHRSPTLDDDRRLGARRAVRHRSSDCLMKSPWGRVLKAIREDETRSAASARTSTATRCSR